jgi:signal transduction histidine kinase
VASIQVIQGPDKGRSFDLLDGENIIGRKSNSVELTDGTVSRQHAKLTPKDGAWLLEDLGSANGTYLNGIRMKQPAALHRGDQVRCGSTLLVFGGGQPAVRAAVDLDEEGQLVDAAIVASVPSNEDSVIIPTPEAGAAAIGTLRIVYDLITGIGSIFDVDLLLQRTMDKVIEVFRSDRGYIMLIDDDGRLVVKASRLANGSADQKVPISRTIINEVVGKQVGLLSSNAMTDKRFAAGKSVHDFGIRSAICVPIKGRERVLGVIHVDCSVSEQTYSTEQLRLLTAIGYQTGLAIDNVRLYEAAVQRERLAAVGETVAQLSHHIKNILQALGAGIDVVEMGLNGNDMAKAKGAWPIVQRNLERINNLILNMLAFSKSREPLLENINVNHVLTECVELVSRRADERGVALMSDLDDLPAVAADPAGLNQAFLNLLDNALDAVTDGTGVITVKSRYDSMNRWIVVSIIDNGTGIPPDQIPNIFTPFWSSKGQRGTGLGLAVAEKVVKEHHGRIQVSSKVREGSTFTVTLPAVITGDSGETVGNPAK